jgi:hypothetical protein
VAKLGFGYRPIEVLGYVPKVATPKLRKRQQQERGRGQHELIGDLSMGDDAPRFQKHRGLAEERQAQLASYALRATSQHHSARPWLLYTQLSLMMWVVGMLLLWGNRQRRPGSPRILSLLPGLNKAAKVHLPQ